MSNVIDMKTIDEIQFDHYNRIARSVTNFKKRGRDNMAKGGAETRLQQVNEAWRTFDSNHAKLMLMEAENKAKLNYFKNELYEVCEEEYYTASAYFSDFISELAPLNDSVANSSTDGKISSKSSLPKITLPQFGGKYQEWTPFRDLFTSIVHNNDSLSQVEKMHYLKSNVTGEASKLICNIPTTEDNYDRAWLRLQSRFENKRALVNAQLEILFSIKPLIKKSAKDLESLRATVTEVLEALEALGAEVNKWDFLLVYFVCRRLDSDTHEAWEIHLGKSTEPPTYLELDSFLEGRIRALETVGARSGQGTKSGSKQPPRTATSLTTTASSSSCAICMGSHYVSSCQSYLSKTPEQRKALVTTHKLCYNCLGPHTLKSCHSDKRCKVCSNPHHTTIHIAKSTIKSSQSAGTGQDSSSSHQSAQASAHPSATVTCVTPQSSDLTQTILPTAVIRISSDDGPELTVRALIDQASEMSFVREAVVQALHLRRRYSPISWVGIGNQQNLATKGRVGVKVKGMNSSEIVLVNAHVLNKITGLVPSKDINDEEWSHLASLDLADPSFRSPSQIDVLLGADVYGQILLGEIKKASKRDPIAQKTIFGWIVSGPSATWKPSYLTLQGYTCSSDQEMHQSVADFWKQEVVSVSPRSKISDDELACEKHYKATTLRRSDGRYVVSLPFKSKPTIFGDSKSIAIKMLQILYRRFLTSEPLKEMYTKFLTEYESLHPMVGSSFSDTPKEDAYYLPHHGVLREASSTTKLRVVFNGSQKTNLGISLNDCLHSGPKIQTELIDVILRWRTYRYVFSADIEKMYRQVLLNTNDQHYQQILWSSDPLEPAKTYQLATVTYGLTSAPFLAIRTLHQLTDDAEDNYPLAKDIVLSNMYVADVLSGCDTVIGAKEKATQLDKLMQSGAFILKKWAANDDSVLTDIDDDRRLSQSNLKTLQDDQVLRALGLKCNIWSDSFECSFHPQDLSAPNKVTKRVILSVLASLFDPLGWLSPIIIRGKIYLQHLWKSNVSWDDPLPSDLARKWRELFKEVQDPIVFSIPRWIGLYPGCSLELHGFSDASVDALSAVLYIRVIQENHYADVRLLTAKTRVAPLKRPTIARLELSAAVLLAQITSRTLESMKFENVGGIHMWTDSMVALVWIKNQPSTWKEFVANRVAAIQDAVPQGVWQEIIQRTWRRVVYLPVS